MSSTRGRGCSEGIDGHGRAGGAGVRTDRAQANLAALVAALVVLVATVGVTLALADGALAGASRDPGERRAAVVTADRFAAADSPLTRRANVPDAAAVAALTPEALVALVPPLADAAFRVRLDGETVLERGDPTDGAVFRRLVLVAEETPRTRLVNASRGVVLPRRSDRVRLGFANASVETVRANGRVVLHRPGGLAGSETVAVSARETVRLAFGPTATGSVSVTYYPERTRKATLEVRVDA